MRERNSRAANEAYLHTRRTAELTRSSLGDLQRIREWIILLARHDSGTKRGILLSRHKNNRYDCPKLTAMSFQGSAVPAFRPAPDSETAVLESTAASSGYLRSMDRRTAVPRGVHGLQPRAAAGHHAAISRTSGLANHYRPTPLGSDNASSHAQGRSHSTRSINSESGGRADG